MLGTVVSPALPPRAPLASPGQGFASLRTLLLCFNGSQGSPPFQDEYLNPKFPQALPSTPPGLTGLAKDVHTPRQCSHLGVTTPSAHALDHVFPETKP